MRPCLTWSPDSKLLAVHTSDEGKAIKLWDGETGKEQEPITALTKWITCLAWSPDGKTLIGGCADGAIRLWSPQTRQHIRTVSGHVNKVSCLLWSPDGSKLVTGSSDKTICVWDIHTWKIQYTLTGHFHEVSCLAWLAPEPQPLIASGSYDRTIRIWDLKNGLEKCRLECHTAPITSLSVSNSGHLLASKAEAVRIWSTKTWEPVEKKEIPPGSKPQIALAFSPRTSQLALVHDEDAAIQILDTQDEQHPAQGAAAREKVVHYAPQKLELPPFLERMSSVDFREYDPDPLEQLIWGITGEKS